MDKLDDVDIEDDVDTELEVDKLNKKGKKAPFQRKIHYCDNYLVQLRCTRKSVNKNVLKLKAILSPQPL